MTFAVADTGLGMTEEQVAKLFQRFQQADASTTRRFGGTGLGLSLTRAFGELLGGEVGVRSAPGEGSTFIMRVPGRACPAAAPRTARAGPEADGRDVVLVIDDDATQRELTSRFLERDRLRGPRRRRRRDRAGAGARDPPARHPARRHDAGDGRLVRARRAQGRPGRSPRSRSSW